jgi:predicted PurR-regulated permease PerM
MSVFYQDVPRQKPSWATIGIFIILLFAAITLARSFLMPLTLAVLLFFVFTPVSRAMARVGVPQVLSATLVTIALLVVVLVAFVVLAVPVATAIEDAPRILAALQAKFAAIEGPLSDIKDAVQRLSSLSIGPPLPEAAIVADSSRGSGVLTSIALTTPAVFGQLIFTLVLLFFALSSRELLYRRTVQSFAVEAERSEALSAMHAIERSLGHYLGAITLINAGLGVAVGFAMWAWGMPAPVLFGVGAFAFNFVPYVGAIAGVLVSTLVALVTLDGFVAPTLVGATYLALTSAEGQFVTPYFVSQRLQLNTVVVFVAVALFAWLWSVVGMIVAVPLLVVLNVVCQHVPGLSGLSAFLSGGEERAFVPERESQPVRDAVHDG